MQRVQRMGAWVVALLVLSGCAANDLVVKRQTETETKVEHLFQSFGRIEARLNELSARMESLEEQDQPRTAAMKDLQDEMRGIRESAQSLEARLNTVAPHGTPRVELVNPGSPARGRDTGPPPSYLKAFGLYSANNFAAAIEAFQQFLKEQPNSEYIPNAQYWIGECYYTSSDLSKALVAFQRVVDEWPRHSKASDALLKIGYSQVALKQPEKAKNAFERLIRSYPGSHAAIKARERLMLIDNPAH